MNKANNSQANSKDSVVIPVCVTTSTPVRRKVVPSLPVPFSCPPRPSCWKPTGKSETVVVCAVANADEDQIAASKPPTLRVRHTTCLPAIAIKTPRIHWLANILIKI